MDLSCGFVFAFAIYKIKSAIKESKKEIVRRARFVCAIAIDKADREWYELRTKVKNLRRSFPYKKFEYEGGL